jgi:aminopeptidase N
VFYFHNQIPIQSYLIALAVGDLVYKETGPTTGVISESVSVDRVAAELD